MKGLDIVLQQATFEKFRMHPLVKDMIHEYLKNLDLVKYNLEILGNFKYGLTTYLLGFRSTQLIIAKNVVCILATNESISSSRGVKSLGVDRWNIKRAMGRWVQLDTIQDAFGINLRQAKRSNATNNERCHCRLVK
jgi:hypothetical protein